MATTEVVHVEPTVQRNHDLETHLSNSLRHTLYECSNLEPLTGGLANFSYRGHLRYPLADNSETIVLKHYQALIARGNGFTLPMTRTRVESGFLRSMSDSSFTSSNISLRSPRHLHFDDETKTEIMEDMKQYQRLRDYLLSGAGKDLSPTVAGSIGECIGGWLAAFHAQDWSHIDEDLSKALHRNREISDRLCETVRVHVLATFQDPDVIAGVQEAIDSMDARGAIVIHGDYTTRNLLIQLPLPPQSLCKGPHAQPINLSIVDWESCQYNSLTMDLGLLLSGLFVHHVSEGSEAAGHILQGVVRGYGPLGGEELVHLTAMMTGLNIFVWDAFNLVDSSHVEELRKRACEMITRGYRRDREWMGRSFLGGFFG